MKIPHWILKFRSVIGLVSICILAVIFSPRALDGSIIFLNPVNLTDVLQQQAEIGIIALAMTLVIISGGIDLSVGSMLAFAASLSAIILVKSQPQLSPAMQMTEGVGAAIGASALLGALNGGVIARMGIQPFIMTLATMIGIRGLTRWMTDNNNIDFGFGNDTPARFTMIFRTRRW